VSIPPYWFMPPGDMTYETMKAADQKSVSLAALVIKSNPVLTRAIAKLGPGKSPFATPEELAKALVVKPEPNTFCVRVRCTARTWDEARRAVSAVMEAFVAHVQESNRQAFAARMQELEAEHNHLARQAEDLRARMALFIKESGLMILDGRDINSAARVTVQTEMLAQADAEAAKAQAAFDHFSDLLKQAEETKDYGPVRAALPGAVQAENDLQAFQDHAARLRVRYKVARESATALREQLAEAKADASRMALQVQDYQAMEQECRRVEKLVDEVRLRIDQARIGEALRRPGPSLIQYPSPPAN